jgi:hypothetical protein
MIVQTWRKKRMPSQREQYGGTVHLFIGTGRSPCKITFMPFTLDNNSIVICRGLNSLFIFKSVSPSAVTPKPSCLHLRRCINLRIILVYCDADLSPKIPVHTLYSKNTIKSCFWGPSDAEGPQQGIYATADLREDRSYLADHSAASIISTEHVIWPQNGLKSSFIQY